MNYPPFDRRYLDWLREVNGRRPQGWLDPWVDRDGLEVPALQPLERESTGVLARFRRWFR